MRALLYSFSIVALTCAAPLHAQTLADLQRLSDAVWGISEAPSHDKDTFEETVLEYFPSATFGGGPSPLALGGIQVPEQLPFQLPPEWDGIAQYHAGYFPDYSYLDAIKCVVMTPEGAALLQSLNDAGDHDARAALPLQFRQFSLRLFEDGAVSAQSCIGVFNPKEDRVEFDTWDIWYDQLEAKFRSLGFEVERSRATSPDTPYAAGFLSAKGSVCDGPNCIIIALPFNVALPSLNTNQTTFNVGSVLYP